MSRTAAKFALVSAILIAPLAQAHAYSIHVKDGEYKIECDNGVTSTGTTLEVTHAEAAHFCKVRGSSITTGDNNPGTGAAAKAAAKSSQAAAKQ